MQFGERWDKLSVRELSGRSAEIFWGAPKFAVHLDLNGIPDYPRTRERRGEKGEGWRMRKRLLAAIVAMVMVVAMVPVAMAEDDADNHYGHVRGYRETNI